MPLPFAPDHSKPAPATRRLHGCFGALDLAKAEGAGGLSPKYSWKYFATGSGCSLSLRKKYTVLKAQANEMHSTLPNDRWVICIIFLELPCSPPCLPGPQRKACSPKRSWQHDLHAQSQSAPAQNRRRLIRRSGTHEIQTHSTKKGPTQVSPGPTADLDSASTSRRHSWGWHFCSKILLAATKNRSCGGAGDSPAPSRTWVCSGDMQGCCHQHHCCMFSTTGQHVPVTTGSQGSQTVFTL